MTFLKLYIISLVSYVILDSLWVGVIASGFYRKQLSFLFVDKINYLPIVVFYFLYVFGIVYIILEPNLSKNLMHVFVSGLVLGLVAYGTYDLVNSATIKEWSNVATIVDMLWGGFATGLVSVITLFISRQL